MQNAIAHEIALVMNWLRWHNQAVEIRRVATVIREELDRLATRFKRATFTSPSTEAFDAIGEALRYLHRVAESIAEPPRPAAVPNRIGPVSARRVGNTPVEVMQGYRQWLDVIEGKAKPADEPNAPFPTLEQLVAQLRELGAFAARVQMPSDQKAPAK